MLDAFNDVAAMLDMDVASRFAMIRKELRDRYKRLADEWDMSVNELQLLMLLRTTDTNTASEIAKQLGVSRSLVSGSVEELVKKGYISTEPDAVDRRIVRISLTPRVDEMKAAFDAMKKEYFDATVKGIDPAELSIFYRVMTQIWQNLAVIAENEKNGKGESV